LAEGQRCLIIMTPTDQIKEDAMIPDCDVTAHGELGNVQIIIREPGSRLGNALCQKNEGGLVAVIGIGASLIFTLNGRSCADRVGAIGGPRKPLVTAGAKWPER